MASLAPAIQDDSCPSKSQRSTLVQDIYGNDKKRWQINSKNEDDGRYNSLFLDMVDYGCMGSTSVFGRCETGNRAGWQRFQGAEVPLVPHGSPISYHGGFHSHRGTQKIVGLQWEIPLKRMIWGYPHFRKAPISGHLPIRALVQAGASVSWFDISSAELPVQSEALQDGRVLL